MPKEITHFTLAKKIHRKMSPDWPMTRAIATHPHLFLIGAVIPDTPFYHLFGKKNRQLMDAAASIHDDISNSFAPLLRLADDGEDQDHPGLWAFLCGVMAHIVSDTVFHPMVFYFSGTENGRMSPENVYRHRFFETALDLYYWDDEPLENDRRFKPLLTNLEVSSETFQEWLFRLYDIAGLGLEMSIQHSLFNHKVMVDCYHVKGLKPVLDRINRLFSHRFDPFVSLFYPFTQPVYRPFFENRIHYRHPVTGKDHWQTVGELENQVISTALGYLEQMAVSWDRLSLKSNIETLSCPNMLTGMYGRGEIDMRFFNTDMNLPDRLYSVPGKV